MMCSKEFYSLYESLAMLVLPVELSMGPVG